MEKGRWEKIEVGTRKIEAVYEKRELKV